MVERMKNKIKKEDWKDIEQALKNAGVPYILYCNNSKEDNLTVKVKILSFEFEDAVTPVKEISNRDSRTNIQPIVRCPNEEHEWVCISISDTVMNYRCTKCGATREDTRASSICNHYDYDHPNYTFADLENGLNSWDIKK